MRFCYHDIAPRNFMITNDDDLYLIDFGHAAFLPESFMSYTLHVPNGPFVGEVAKRLSVQRSSNLEAMNSVRYHFGMRDSSAFGKNSITRRVLYVILTVHRATV
jgi:serine/threonine protein kinase